MKKTMKDSKKNEKQTKVEKPVPQNDGLSVTSSGRGTWLKVKLSESVPNPDLPEHNDPFTKGLRTVCSDDYDIVTEGPIVHITSRKTGNSVSVTFAYVWRQKL